jgi:choline monooxygenase
MNVRRSEIPADGSAQAKAMPAEVYTEPRYHGLDRAMLRAHWQYFGPSSWFESEGHAVPGRILGVPVIVLRGPDGLRGLLNICRHRGGPLLVEAGQLSHFRCRYHGWIYGLDGRLKGAPGMEGAEGFDRDDYRLGELAVQERDGMVFVTLGDGSAPLPASPLALPDPERALLPRAPVFAFRERYIVQSDWKLYVENFLESYHLPLVHPQYAQAADFRDVKIEVGPDYSMQALSLEEGSIWTGLWEGKAAAHYLFIFPNLMYNILPGRLQVNRVLPLEPGQCEIVFDYFHDSAATGDVAATLGTDRQS